MRKIGFIDFFLDEWHANNYPNWIRDNCNEKKRDFALAYAYAAKDKEGGLTTDEWCEKFGVKRCGTMEELVSLSDCIVVLSPDNPEQHEALANAALRSGKPVYVDKTFAPDKTAAERMFALAEKHETPMYSSSALRFAAEIREYRESSLTADSVVATGGYDFATHGIHTLEMIVTVMKEGAKRVRAEMTGRNKVFVVEYRDGRRATAVQSENGAIPYTMCFEKDGSSWYASFQSDFFRDFIDAMLTFFETEKPEVTKGETMDVMALIDAAKAALNCPGEWVEI